MVVGVPGSTQTKKIMDRKVTIYVGCNPDETTGWTKTILTVGTISGFF